MKSACVGVLSIIEEIMLIFSSNC